jgi:dihydrofolate synthase/folylpolyglutamate synthase
MDRLGTTVAAIAREKAAIVKRGDLAVTGTEGEALAIVRRRCRRLDVPLTVVEPAPLLGIDRDGIVVDLPGLRRTTIGLRGRHQGANVAVADAVLDALEVAGIADSPGAARRSGYASARWPGRLELLTIGGRDVLLDGAHNVDGAAALAEAVDDLAPVLSQGRPTLVLGIMADKDVPSMLAALGRSASLAGARVICTAPPGGRAMRPADLADAWHSISGGRPTTAPDPAAAIEAAMAAGDGPVVVAGSLYLVGAVRALLVDDPDLRDPERPDPLEGPDDG